MKKTLYAVLLGALIIIASCSKDKSNNAPLTWKESVSIQTKVTSKNANFIYQFDPSANSGTWSNSKVSAEFDINGLSSSQSPVIRADIYIYLQEKTATGFSTAGGIEGKKLTSVTSFSPTGIFSLDFNLDELYNIFKDDLKTPRPDKFLETDKFEVKWVLTSADGDVFDGRKEPINIYNPALFGFKVSKESADNTWLGTFDYKILQAMSDTKVKVGDLKTIAFTKNGDIYTTPDLQFSGGLKGEMVPGSFLYDPATGRVTVQSDGGFRYNITWTISNITTSSIDLNWANKYGDAGKIQLTRKDGKAWPSNMK